MKVLLAGRVPLFNEHMMMLIRYLVVFTPFFKKEADDVKRFNIRFDIYLNYRKKNNKIKFKGVFNSIKWN